MAERGAYVVEAHVLLPEDVDASVLGAVRFRTHYLADPREAGDVRRLIEGELVARLARTPRP